MTLQVPGLRILAHKTNFQASEVSGHGRTTVLEFGGYAHDINRKSVASACDTSRRQDIGDKSGKMRTEKIVVKRKE